MYNFTLTWKAAQQKKRKRTFQHNLLLQIFLFPSTAKKNKK